MEEICKPMNTNTKQNLLGVFLLNIKTISVYLYLLYLDYMKKALLFLIAGIIVVIFFYPKHYTVGTTSPDQSPPNCFGYQSRLTPIGIDGGTDFLCYGIVFGTKNTLP